jgi:hypothetical protein
VIFDGGRRGVAAGIVLVLVVVLVLVLDSSVRQVKLIHTQRLEGSRFVILQLYRLVAGGSRE